MGAHIDHAEFVGAIYDAAVSPDLWPRLLERFADLVGGDGAMLMWQNQLTGQGVGIHVRFDSRAPELFFGHFAARNPLRPPAPEVRRAIAHFIPRIVTDEHRIAKSDLMKTEFYNDFMAPCGFHSTLTIGLAIQGADGATLDVTRPRRRGQFTDEDIAISRNLQPHFVRAFELSRKLAGAGAAGEDLAWVLDRLDHGVFLLDDRGAVRHANRAAERLIGEGHGLTVSGGRLSACAPEAGRRLAALIGQAATTEAERRRGGTMALAARARRRPLSVSVTPARSDYHSVFHAGPAVIVCVTDLDAKVNLPAQTLQDIFGLSRGEARIALALFDGLDPREVAARLGLSVHTVRGHLIRIFEKTGARGQVELARLLMRATGIGIG